VTVGAMRQASAAKVRAKSRKTGDAYKLGSFKAFVGQEDHLRHEAFLKPARIS
jgi:hypothetical protein